MDRLSKKNKALRYSLIAIFTIMSAGIINAGYIYYLNYKAQYKTEIEEQLSAIGKLKADELSYWRKERFGDGKIFYKNAEFAQVVSRYFNDPNDTNAKEQIKTWLNIGQASYQYDKCMLLDNQYHKKMVIPEGTERPVSYVSEDASKILQSGEIAFEDFYWNEENKQIYLKVLVPIMEKEGGRMIGAVAIRIDPKKYLYPFLENWPVPSMTAESQLVRKGGNGVQFLNEMKFQKDTALKMSRSIANKDLPSVKAVLGYEGIIDGIDYRGKPVIADVRAVPDSPWFLVTKMDESEIYAPLHKKQWSIIVFVGVLLAGAGASVGFVLKRRTAGIYQQKYDEAKEWNKTFDAIGDMVSVVDKDMRLKTVNKTFADVFGKTPEELVGKRCCELMHGTKEPPENCPMRKTLATKKEASTEIYYEALRKHLELSTYPVLDDKGEITETVHFIRDITKRKLMEEGRRRTDVQLRDALRFNQEVISSACVGVVVYDTQLRYVEWNAFMENMTGMKRKEIIGKKETEVFPHVLENGVDKLLGRALGGETVSSPDVAYQCPQTGKTGWVVNTYTPHHNSTGRIIGVIGIVRDITERKQTEETLKNNENMFRGIATAVPVGLGTASDRKIRWINDYLLQLIGREREEIIGGDSRIFYENEEGYNLVGDKWYKELREKGKAEIEVNWKHKDGRIINILLTGVALNRQDVSQGIVFAALDITERKRAEESLKNRENMFRSIATAVPVGLSIAANRKTVWMNDYFLQLIGREKEEVIGKDSRIFYENDEGYNLVGGKYYKELIEKGKAEIEVNWKHKNGRVLNILLTGVALDKQDISRGVVFAVLDLTERKQGAEVLRESEKRFKNMVEATSDWIWECDKEGLYTYASPKVKNLLGYEVSEVLGKTSFDLMPEEERAKIGKLFKEKVAKKEAFCGLENINRHKDGHLVTMETSAVPVFDEKGQLKGYRGIDRDITERKRAEERLLAVNALQESLLFSNSIEQKLKLITDAVVRIMDADFARIWVIKPGDKCETGCIHAEVTEGPHVCRFRDKCLHLISSSGRYTHIDGKGHNRVPFGCYKIGLIASGDEDKFLTNEAASDPHVHNHAWAKELGLVSFAGYRLTHSDGAVLGVMALFSKHPISPEENALLEGIAHSTSMLIHASQMEEELHKSSVGVN